MTISPCCCGCSSTSSSRSSSCSCWWWCSPTGRAARQDGAATPASRSTTTGKEHPECRPRSRRTRSAVASPPATSGTGCRSSTRRRRTGGSIPSSPASSCAFVYMALFPSFPYGRVFPRPARALQRVAVDADVKGLESQRAFFDGQDQIRPDRRGEGRPAIAGGGHRRRPHRLRQQLPALPRPGGEGRLGYPSLADDIWLWGGTLADIQQTSPTASAVAIEKARNSVMPSFGADGLLTGRRSSRSPILSGATFYGHAEPGPDLATGRALFADELRRLPWRQRPGRPRRRRAAAEIGHSSLRRPARRRSWRRSPTRASASCRTGTATPPAWMRPPSRASPSTCTRSAAGNSPPGSAAAIQNGEKNIAMASMARSDRGGGRGQGQPPALFAAAETVYPKAVQRAGRGRSSGVCWCSAWPSTTCCRGCAGTAARGVPDQAVLLDLPNRRFYFFNLEFWPQDIYFLTGVLILAAVALFLVTSLVGRVWCGYACPQTVWTDLFMLVERRIEGDRNARMQPRPGPLTVRQAWRKARQARALAGHRVLDRRRLDHVFRRCADRDAASSGRGGRRHRSLCLHLPVHRHHLSAGRLGARAGLHLYVPLAALPGRDARRAEPHRYLPGLARRAARARQARRQARQGSATASIARLRACLPHRHRHPRRRAARMHQLRPVHRCLQRHDGQDRPAEMADHLGHAGRPEGQGAGPAREAPLLAPAHADLRRRHGGWR